MANETRDYLDRYSRITADNVLVTLFRLNPDGTYQAREVATGAEYPVSRPNRVTWYRLNERVEVSRPSATRNVVGAMPVILTPGPMEQRGLSATTPNEQREGSGRTVILSVDPDPLVLRIGGLAGEQIIIGTGFDSMAATYENPIEGGADPTLTDSVAPVATDTKVTMNISADSGATGEFDVVVNGARAPKALRILPGAAHTAFLWAHTSDATKPLLFQISVADDATELAQVHTYTGPVVSPKIQHGGMAGYGNTLYWLMTNGTVSYLATINPTTFAITTVLLSFVAKAGTPLFVDTESMAYGDQNPRLLCLGTIGASAGLIAFELDGSGATIVLVPISLNFNGFTHLQAGSLTAAGTLNSKRQLKPGSGGTSAATSTLLHAGAIIAVRAFLDPGYGAATGIFVTTGNGAGVWECGTLSDLAITSTWTEGTETTALGFMVQVGDLIVAMSSSGRMHKFEPAIEVGSVIGPLVTMANAHIATDGDQFIYIGDGNPAMMKKYDLGGTLHKSGTTLTGSTSSPRFMLYF